ncbi:HlyD family secretion protein [Pseudomonas guariconensis]|uniref:HlyD family secretion protein n=1 Tax=Pseudomonas guariconensis TaxID=1288410 RepID=A0AAX0W1U3_9PSED|nr:MULTISPECIES: HlyD family secretion protein [Pseudomonas]MBH3359231.1 HlyD family secretion protein [Pseudomonas guariconensis]MCO7620495.1 HlyD family secretion protein [Pseudomonas guariconensis]MDM9592465.1 HlyD family secretion protein [Pseudomonas guariconensis]MDM9605292.1 HlyD family secretion protein [Pseudomonas guariconensis]MDM9610249.1 HlyD family secretion protein [Pseudomonas guariconensis]
MKPVFSKALTLAVLALALVLGWFAWDYYTRAPWTRDARVRADVVTLSAEVAGRIIELPIHDNQFVKQGELLLQIDPARYELAVLHAERAVEVARAALGQSKASIVANEALLKQRRSEEQRRRRLQSLSAISAEEWEKSGTDVAVAQADLLREQSNLGLAQANVQLAEATLKQARLDLERTRVTAPVSGYVTNLLTRQGDFAQSGTPLLALVDSSSFHVSGYFEETKLPKIKVGSHARIALMSGEVLEGTVESIAYAITDRENQPGNRLLANVNPSYTWVKLAQRIPVRLRLERSADAPPLRAGTTATVTIVD